MKIIIDTNAQTIEKLDGGTPPAEIDLYSDEGFELLSHLWLKVGWNQKYTYTFSWLGVPVIQLPDDMLRMQEIITTLQPDVIIETGIAHGGSLIFSASLCEVLGNGRVIGVDVDIRPHNRKAIEEHRMFKRITMFEGSSIDPDIVSQIKACIEPGETVLVVLDSDHSYAHVMDELGVYGPLVTEGSYVVSTDGFMRHLTDVPRGEASWKDDNPANAAEDFVKDHPEFVIETPAWPFSESSLKQSVTHWPSAWLRRIGR